ncbi:MAG: hypothetical protein H7331_10310 [Bacteroidia bacterium]|nr:hypothetical protein [Bacteroidia bacterium]
MHIYFKLVLFCCVLFTVVSSCKKETESTNVPTTATNFPAPTATTPTVSNGAFTWIENNIGNTNEADSARYTYLQKSIYAFKLGMGTSFKITLTANTPDTYTISSANTFALSKGSVSYKAISGSVVINDNTNGKLTGAYNVTMNTGGLNNVKGEFSEVPLK